MCVNLNVLFFKMCYVLFIFYLNVYVVLNMCFFYYFRFVRSVMLKPLIMGAMRESGLHDLIYTGYTNVPHALLRSLCERWHTETSNFYLHVGEMTITLDNVVCLLHIPIEGILLSHPKKVSQVYGVELVVAHLGVPQVFAEKLQG